MFRTTPVSGEVRRSLGLPGRDSDPGSTLHLRVCGTRDVCLSGTTGCQRREGVVRRSVTVGEDATSFLGVSTVFVEVGWGILSSSWDLREDLCLTKLFHLFLNFVLQGIQKVNERTRCSIYRKQLSTTKNNVSSTSESSLTPVQ